MKKIILSIFAIFFCLGALTGGACLLGGCDSTPSSIQTPTTENPTAETPTVDTPTTDENAGGGNGSKIDLDEEGDSVHAMSTFNIVITISSGEGHGSVGYGSNSSATSTTRTDKQTTLGGYYVAITANPDSGYKASITSTRYYYFTTSGTLTYSSRVPTRYGSGYGTVNYTVSFTALPTTYTVTVKYSSSSKIPSSSKLNIAVDGSTTSETISLGGSTSFTFDAGTTHSIMGTPTNSGDSHCETRCGTTTNYGYCAVTGINSSRTLTFTAYARRYITYDGNGSTGGSTSQTSVYYGDDATVASNGFTRTNYDFLYWSTSSSSGTKYEQGATISNLTSNMTLYARWSFNPPYTWEEITYEANYPNGTTDTYTQDVRSDSSVGILSASECGFSYTGYTWSHWNTKSNGTGVNWYDYETWSGSRGSDTLYAIWDINTYTISYNNNGGTGTMSSSTKAYGVPLTLRACTFTRTGYEFMGWSTSSGENNSVNYADQGSYTANASDTLYAVWEPAVYRIELNANGGSGGLSAVYVKYNTGYYSNSSASTAISSVARPSRTAFSFQGYYLANNTSSTCMINADGSFADAFTTTYFTAPATLYAQWEANNPAYYDEEGGYWYIENGRLPQTRVSGSLKTTLQSSWGNLETGSTYTMDATGDMVAKIYEGNEYCTYNGEYYLVELIKWRLTSSASQTVGYGTTTATYAIMDTIVYVGRYSVTEIGAGDGYQDVCIDYIKESYLSETYLASDTKSMPTFGTGASLNGASQSFTDTVFVSSREEIMAVAGTYQIKFSDFVMDFMTSFKGTVPLYYTRDLGTNYNHIICLTEDGEVVQRQPDQIYNQLGIQFTVKFSEYACVER